MRKSRKMRPKANFDQIIKKAKIASYLTTKKWNFLKFQLFLRERRQIEKTTCLWPFSEKTAKNEQKSPFFPKIAKSSCSHLTIEKWGRRPIFSPFSRHKKCLEKRRNLTKVSKRPSRVCGSEGFAQKYRKKCEKIWRVFSTHADPGNTATVLVVR